MPRRRAHRGGNADGDTRHEPFCPFSENVGFRMSQEQTANHLATVRYDRNGQVTADRKVSQGHPKVWIILSVTRIFADIT